jgi:hypothetical protein
VTFARVVRRGEVGAVTCASVAGEGQCWGESSPLASPVDVHHHTMERAGHVQLSAHTCSRRASLTLPTAVAILISSGSS